MKKNQVSIFVRVRPGSLAIVKQVFNPNVIWSDLSSAILIVHRAIYECNRRILIKYPTTCSFTEIQLIKPKHK